MNIIIYNKIKNNFLMIFFVEVDFMQIVEFEYDLSLRKVIYFG